MPRHREDNVTRQCRHPASLEQPLIADLKKTRHVPDVRLYPNHIAEQHDADANCRVRVSRGVLEINK